MPSAAPKPAKAVINLSMILIGMRVNVSDIKIGIF